MVLSNAERQARFRARLKARANGDALPDQARDAVVAALTAIWNHEARQGIPDMSLDEHLAYYRSDVPETLRCCEAYEAGDFADAADWQAVERARDLLHAVSLHHLPEPPKKRRR